MEQNNASEQSNYLKKKMPIWFRALFIFLLLFSLFFGYGFYLANFLSESQIAAMPEAMKELFLDIPKWVMFAGGTGVLSSIIGNFLVVFGKKQGAFILLIAPIMATLRDGWFMIDGRVMDLIPTFSLILSSLGFLAAFIQPVLAFYGIKKGWLK